MTKKVGFSISMFKMSFLIFFVVFRIGTAGLASDEPRKIMEFADIDCDTEQGLVDGFASELQKNPEALGYIILYGGKMSRCRHCSKRRLIQPQHGEAEARGARLKGRLVHFLGFSPERIIVINGGYRETWMAEMWIVPVGSKPPIPTPTLQEKNIKFGKGKATERNYRWDCAFG